MAEQQLGEVTECSICMNAFTDPRMLPCIHTFCFNCLQSTSEAEQKKPGDKMPCPLCRKEFVIPKEGINGVQKNFFMENLLQYQKTLQGESAIIICDMCNIRNEGKTGQIPAATMRCLECQDNYCDSCVKVHQFLKVCHDHHVVDIGFDMKSDRKRFFSIKSCTKHIHKPLDYYCADCKKVVCVSCFVESHSLHKCKDVTSVDEEFRQTIEKKALKMSDFMNKTLIMRSEREKKKADFLKVIVEKEREITNRHQKLKDMIDRHKKSLLDELSVIKSTNLKEIECEMGDIETYRAILSSFEAYCNELTIKGSASDICSSVDQLIFRADELERDHEAFIGRPHQSIEVTFRAADLSEILQKFNDNLVGNIKGGIKESAEVQQGLTNFGNTCYFNAVVQCLCQTFLLLNGLSHRTYTSEQQPLTNSFLRFWNYRCIGEPEQNKAFSMFFKQLIESSPKFQDFKQHDSHDLFIHFLNDLRSEERLQAANCSQPTIEPRKVLTTVDKVFGGHFITAYVCLKCSEPYYVCECLLDISLPICIPQLEQQQQRLSSTGRGSGEANRMSGQQNRVSTAEKFNSYSDKEKELERLIPKALNEEQRIPTHDGGRYQTTRQVALADCLRSYTATEHIPYGYLCLSCQDRNQSAATINPLTMPAAKKRTLIYNPPAVLVLHMKRFERTSTGYKKRSDRVSYEELLDLGPYCSSDCLRIDPKYKNVWYSLYGVVVHSGSLDCGHYTAYVKIRDPKEKVTETFLQDEFLDRDRVTTEQKSKLTSTRESKRVDQKMQWRPKEAIGEHWMYLSDSHARAVPLHEVLNQEAFMLFYERVLKCDQ